MQQSGNRQRNAQGKVAMLCILLSISVHVAGAWLLLQLPEPQKSTADIKTVTATKALKIKRSKKKEKEAAKAEQQEAPVPKPFAKTDADRREERPEEADFQGKRNSQAEGVSDGPQRSDDSPVPTMAGEEKEEINTVERERQDGPIEHEGKNQPTSAPPPTPEPAPGVPDSPPTPQPDKGDDSTTNPAEATATAQPVPENKDGDIKLHPTEQQTPTDKAQQAAPSPGQPDSAGKSPAPPRPKVHRPIYDPSLADHAQPGFRTTERRSRSTGRFILGRNPALNVSATPMGRYEELIYRLVARRWYMACDEHRGDIIPGTIIIAFRLNKRGSVETMNLITRRGASVIQQSFTFGAIRRAQLPPMPPAVQRELIGEQLELIFTFNFD